jgi:hypothetical protein
VNDRSPSTPRWLLLAHQLPSRPSNARVKTWRRLQQIGAVPARNSVYVLPNTEACREDFEWMRSEIVALGGEATVFAADALSAGGADEIEATFRRARDADYEELLRLSKKLRSASLSGEGQTRTVNQLRERLNEIRRVDFFHARAGEAASDAIDLLEHRLAGRKLDRKETPVSVPSKEFMNRRWVTRPRPGVDRMASAWLIRRFIDSNATFGFVDRPEAADVPFDMYTGDFSHQGERCTFEVLAQRFGVADPAVVRLAQIVHDLDMKENRYSAPEAPAVSRMVEGLRQLHADDAALLEQGMTMFEALARSFASTEPPKKATARRRQASRARKTKTRGR